MTKLVAYLRVSTQKQGKSGLGLEAQTAAIDDYARQHGAEIVATYQEVESGKRDDRAELAKALAHAKKAKAALVIAKLDRLGRNAAFLLQLQASPVRIIIADQPHIDKMMFGILAVFAESERDATSARTKAALKAAKARGVKLGSPKAAETAIAAAAINSARARERARNIIAIIQDIERSGVSTLAGVAAALESRGVKTPRGNVNWHPSQVAHIRSMAA